MGFFIEYGNLDYLIKRYHSTTMPVPMPTPTPNSSASPTMPGSSAGAPPHPGSSPVTAPGGGAGNSAAAAAAVKAAMPILYKALTAFPPGSKENKAVLSAIQALNPIFAESGDKALVPAAIQQMAQAAKSGGPLASAPAPGLANAPSPDLDPSTPSPIAA